MQQESHPREIIFYRVSPQSCSSLYVTPSNRAREMEDAGNEAKEQENGQGKRKQNEK